MLGISSLSSAITIVLYVILAIFVLLLMVTIHELGHYVVGRIFNFKITEFSIGFGKAIYSKINKRGEKISIRIFPLGGYCSFDGENDDDPNVVREGSFNSHAPWKRILVFLGGPLFNILSAFIFSFILLVSYGYDVRQVAEVKQYFNNGELNPNYSVILVDDAIYKVGGIEIDFAKGNTFNSLISAYKPGEPITLTVKRNGEFKDIEVVLNVTGQIEDKTIVELGITTKAYPLPVGEALLRTVPFTFGLIWLVMQSLWMLVTFQLSYKDIGGPIAIVSLIATETAQNFGALLFITPLIAANLGVFNLVPFPALDGSHIVFTAIEWIRGKPINRKVEAYIHFIGLVILFSFIVIMDLIQLIT